MLRNSATRALLRSVPRSSASQSSFAAASFQRQWSNKRFQNPAALARPTRSSFYATVTEPPFDKINDKREHKIAKQVIEPDPKHVSVNSSTRTIFEERPAPKDDDEMLRGIKVDLATIKETFSLAEVPRESLYIGAAGVLPYAATSLSTVYLAWDINHAQSTGTNGVLFDPQTAYQLLELVSPLQIGYGAVIISFLGAIHWGLEYAGYGGYHSYRRYMYGVIGPAIAWPTIFMPVEYALITQFLAFNFLYFADARATVRGWFPPWYSTYRFVLTFLVGASIVATLVGRGQIVSPQHTTLKSPIDYIKGDRDAQWEALEKEEKERRQALAKADEEEEANNEEEK
ncbi:hypothetical protein BJ875DRAFT_951 [Amylocarpus encephaloides]|uniref:Mitochondrial inner membrane protein 1 n=1 Tax=Amylocarpus encephaloides TaxID=45428 RepID=A0A9P7YTI6_9HELO|nr:hypothetical protein BJ875DRAFT_951 [Amylocarpus encephaloides]